MDINSYNLKCCEIFKNTKKEDGLYDYYHTRLVKENRILNKDDEELIKYFLENVDIKSNIIELAAGIGQLSHYLNLNGFNNVTINECDIKRLRLAVELNKELNNNCIINHGIYQKVNFSNYDYILTINAISSSHSDGMVLELPIFEKILNMGKKVIIKEGYIGNYCHAIKQGKYDTSFTDKLKQKYKHKVLFKTDSNFIIFYK